MIAEAFSLSSSQARSDNPACLSLIYPMEHESSTQLHTRGNLTQQQFQLGPADRPVVQAMTETFPESHPIEALSLRESLSEGLRIIQHRETPESPNRRPFGSDQGPSIGGGQMTPSLTSG
jgi:hypothetical protein